MPYRRRVRLFGIDGDGSAAMSKRCAGRPAGAGAGRSAWGHDWRARWLTAAACVCAPAVSRHRRLVSIGDKAPQVGAGAFIAPSASIVGSVDIGANVSVWYGAVVRSDDGSATFIGEDTTIGVNAILRTMGAEPMVIGSRVVVGTCIARCAVRGA